MGKRMDCSGCESEIVAFREPLLANRIPADNHEMGGVQSASRQVPEPSCRGISIHEIVREVA